MTIICLEGPDLAGKTTVAKMIQSQETVNKISTTYIKRGPIREDPMTEYLRPLDTLVKDPRQTLILDRWHVGELIYGPLLRGRSELTEQQANYVEMVMQSLGCAFIHVTADIPTLQDRWDIRGDSLIKREWLQNIADAYWRYTTARSHWAHFVAGGAGGFMPTEPSPLPGRYIGPRDPAVLLLGDERASDEFTWPFVPRRATSGHWLMGALHAANINHMRVGVVNACELDDQNLNQLWYRLGQPPVVTLGRNAERAWRMSGDSKSGVYTYLHHPQYQRRFHYQTFAEYGQVIKDTMK